MQVGPVRDGSAIVFATEVRGSPGLRSWGLKCAREILALNGIYINSMQLCQFATIGGRIVKARRKQIFPLGLSRLPKVWLVADPGVGCGGEELRGKGGDVS